LIGIILKLLIFSFVSNFTIDEFSNLTNYHYYIGVSYFPIFEQI